MNELEQGLEGLINQVSKMIFDLLGSLDINEVKEKSSDPVNFLQISLISVVKHLNSQIHVATDAPAFGILLHMIVHLVKTRFIWAQANVKKDCILSVYLPTEAIEEPIMR